MGAFDDLVDKRCSPLVKQYEIGGDGDQAAGRGGVPTARQQPYPVLGRELKKAHPMRVEEPLDNHRLSLRFSHCSECVRELIGTVDQYRLEPEASPPGGQPQVLYEWAAKRIGGRGRRKDS